MKKIILAFLLLTGLVFGQAIILLTGSSGGSSALATPIDSPGPGTYGSAQTVTFSNCPSGGVCCYRLDNVNPTATTPGICDSPAITYSGGFSTGGSTVTLKAIASKVAFTNSSPSSSLYTISGASISVVGSAGYSSPSGAGNTVEVVNLAMTAGNAALIAIYYNNTPPGVPLVPTSVKLSDGTTSCTSVAGGLEVSAQQSTEWWYQCLSIPSGITGVSVVQTATGASGFVSVSLLEVANLTTGFDQAGTVNIYSPSGLTWTTTAVTPTSGIQALIAGVAVGTNTAAMTATSPYVTYAAANVGYSIVVGAQVVSSTTGSYTPNGANASSQAGVSLAASFK